MVPHENVRVVAQIIGPTKEAMLKQVLIHGHEIVTFSAYALVESPNFLQRGPPARKVTAQKPLAITDDVRHVAAPSRAQVARDLIPEP